MNRAVLSRRPIFTRNVSIFHFQVNWNQLRSQSNQHFIFLLYFHDLSKSGESVEGQLIQFGNRRCEILVLQQKDGKTHDAFWHKMEAYFQLSNSALSRLSCTYATICPPSSATKTYPSSPVKLLINVSRLLANEVKFSSKHGFGIWESMSIITCRKKAKKANLPSSCKC